MEDESSGDSQLTVTVFPDVDSALIPVTTFFVDWATACEIEINMEEIKQSARILFVILFILGQLTLFDNRCSFNYPIKHVCFCND